jgi:uncharacterized protein YcbX
MGMQITRIFTYPVKGLNAHPLGRVSLIPFEALPMDRAFALARPDNPFDARSPAPVPKQHFLMLMRDEEMARFNAHLDTAAQTLAIYEAGTLRAQGALATAAGRGEIENFFAAVFAHKIERPPRLVSAPGHTFSDVGAKVVSLINQASIRDLEAKLGTSVHPLRFRANLYFDGGQPWAEFDWIGREIAIGGARLKVVKRIERCAATTVNPETAVRDLEVPKALRRHYGHTDMGVYAKVIAGGDVASADTLTVQQNPA